MLQRLQGGVKQAVDVMQASEERSQETVRYGSRCAAPNLMPSPRTGWRNQNCH